MSKMAIRKAQPANPVSANTGNAQVFNLVSNAAVPATVAVPGKLVLEQSKFKIRASGNVLTAGNYTVQATLLYAITIPAVPLTSGNWTVLGSGTARAVNTTYSPWWIESDLIFESIGGSMQGTFTQLINNLLDASAALTNRLTGLNGSNQSQSGSGAAIAQTDPVFYLACAITFGTASAGNVANLQEFVLEN